MKKSSKSEYKKSNIKNEKKSCLYCGELIDLYDDICPKCGANFNTGEGGINGGRTYSYSSDVTIAFIFSLIGLLCFPIFAIPAFIKANRCLDDINAGRIPSNKRGLAIAAKIISILTLIFWTISILLIVVVNN